MRVFTAIAALIASVAGLVPPAKSVAETGTSLHLVDGSGRFALQGGPGHESAEIRVCYHKPRAFSRTSPILLVIPGAGRDACEYRDAWVEASQRHGILVLAPRYAEADYDFGWYHLGGLVEETNAVHVANFLENSHQVEIDEDRAFFRVNANREEYIFNDFDRIFERVAEAVGSTRQRYDVFGHSAGGQILHRMVLVQPEIRANRVVAANSGFYTLPELTSDIPFGLRNAPVNTDDLRTALGRELVLLLGEADDGPEAGGTFLRSTSADRQGLGRLQRGRYFHARGRAAAQALGAEFNWTVETVPGVGHDHAAMSRAAAALLYAD